MDVHLTQQRQAKRPAIIGVDVKSIFKSLEDEHVYECKFKITLCYFCIEWRVVEN